MSAYTNPSMRLPIWRDAKRLLLEIEIAVRGFPRYHKYTLGTEMRTQAMRVCQLLSRAIAARGQRRIDAVRRLLEALDDLKIAIQLARELKAFSSFSVFQRVVEWAVRTGKQGGAWLRRLTSGKAGPEPTHSS